MALTSPKLQESQPLLDLLQAQTIQISNTQKTFNSEVSYDFLLRRICLTHPSYKILHIVSNGAAQSSSGVE